LECSVDCLYSLSVWSHTEAPFFFSLSAESNKSKFGGGSSSSGSSAEINAKVLAEIKSMLEGKSSEELEDLQEDIKKSLKEGKSSDVAYWETMQAEVKLQLARQSVQETHIDLLQKQLEILSEMRAEVKVRYLVLCSAVHSAFLFGGRTCSVASHCFVLNLKFALFPLFLPLLL
jgi:hypothetical protein